MYIIRNVYTFLTGTNTRGISDIILMSISLRVAIFTIHSIHYTEYCEGVACEAM